jgi:aerobic carbon-monoxide dehydrogenase large subunit
MHAVGSPIVRKEDARLLTGQGCYIADLQFKNMSHGVVVRSTHAHAHILKVDIEQAAAMPGILLVLAATDPAVAKLGGIPWELRPPVPADAEGSNDKRLDLALQRILARDVVRYVGEPVAFVVGESLAAAQAAAEVVGVDYEALPSVTAPDEAVADGAPILWPEFPNNVYFPFERGDRATVDAAFAGASHVTEVELRNNRLAANPMEPRGCVGIFGNRQTSSAQARYRARRPSYPGRPD